jgi:hypothetical protein
MSKLSYQIGGKSLAIVYFYFLTILAEKGWSFGLIRVGAQEDYYKYRPTNFQ